MTAPRPLARPVAPSTAELPLIRHIPALAAIPRARLGAFPTPVERLDGFDGTLWVKRDDLDAEAIGGNKVRALEFLLGRVREGDTVLTLGGEGSTHVLSTAAHAAHLGAKTIALRWRHAMHPVAREVAARAAALCDRVVDDRWIATSYARALALRARGTMHYIPLGGSTPLGILGHVNAGLELAEQIASGALPRVVRVVVPLGSGGTAAGLSLGFALAGLETIVVGARVGPRVGANLFHVRRLIGATRRLIARYAGAGAVPTGRAPRLEIAHGAYGGAYGRPHPAAERAAARLERLHGLRLDATYSAKAFAIAHDLAEHTPAPVLFWLTFDARWLRSAEAPPASIAAPA